MLDIALFRTNPDLIKENIKKKFQEEKLELVDRVVELDVKVRELKAEGDNLRNKKKNASKEIGALMAKGQSADAERAKETVAEINRRLGELDVSEGEISQEIRQLMMVIPNIIADTVPIGRDDSENIEIKRFGDPVVPDFEIPYHVDIMEKLNGIDLESARKTSGNGFYYLKGNIARLHSAVLSYARDFMIDRGFTYYIPPFMIRSSVVTGVMSFKEMEDMMYKIQGEDLYLMCDTFLAEKAGH